MRALIFQGRRSVSVETVPDPVIEQPIDAIIRVTSTGMNAERAAIAHTRVRRFIPGRS